MRAVATARATRSPRAVVDGATRARARDARRRRATTTRARFARTALATSALMTMGARAARAASANDAVLAALARRDATAPDGATARRLRGDVDEATRARTLALAGCVATRDATTRRRARRRDDARRERWDDGDARGTDDARGATIGTSTARDARCEAKIYRNSAPTRRR